MFSKFFKRDSKGQSEPEPPSSEQPNTPSQSGSQASSGASAQTPPPTPSSPSGIASVRMVQCAKLGRRLPGLARPPFPGELGQRIYEHISSAAYDMWKQQAVMLVNHYGLVGADPEARKWLNQQMEAFLFEDEVTMPEGWTPEDEGGSQGGAKGSPMGGAKGSAKGAPAPARK